MKINIAALVVVVFLGISDAGKIKVSQKRYDSSYQHEPIQYVETAYVDPHAIEHIDSSGHVKGFSAGSGLRSIAQGSANQAHSAVANQHAAARQASYVAKSTLAQSAIQSAATAHAALAGKEVYLQGLEQQSAEARHILEGEIAQLQLAKSSAALAADTAQQATHHINVLTGALNSAQAVVEQAEQAAKESAAQLASQSTMVGRAKTKLQSLEEQLNSARIDFGATKEAAEKASLSAQEAQNNAAAAGHHASAELHDASRKAAAIQQAYANHHIVSGPVLTTHAVVGGHPVVALEGEHHYEHH